MFSNRQTADLHTHTTASDGVLSPAGLVERARETGLCALAVTDHDTLEGTPEAVQRGKELGINVLTGVELSAGEDGETHILGYGKPESQERMREFFEERRQDREARAHRMIEKLAAAGMPLNEAAIRQSAKGSIGRPHIAREMVRRGYAADMQDAFERWLKAGRPGYEKRKPLDVTAAIVTLKNAGFIPVLAHPALLEMDENTFFFFLESWMRAGLQGVEAFHPANERERGCAFYERAARKRGLLVTGGSDYHDDEGHDPLGAMSALWRACTQDYQALLDQIECQDTLIVERE